MNQIFLYIVVLFLFIVQCFSNVLDSLEKPKSEYIPKNRRILEHSESGKCLTVSDEFVLILEKCNFELEEPLIAGVFHVIKSNRGGHLMKWATQPIPGAIEGCLRALPPKNNDKNKKQQLQLVECDPRDPTLNWEFTQIEESKHLLKKFPSGPCVVANGHQEGSGIHAIHCNENDIEQIWQICENVDHRKCDL